MSLRFPKAPGARSSFRPGAGGTTGLTPLQKITQAYRERQASVTNSTQQKISELSQQRSRLTNAAAVAQADKDKPMQTYLDRSGQMVERRITSLQAKINGLKKP
jgi:hypothetical protein